MWQRGSSWGGWEAGWTLACPWAPGAHTHTHTARQWPCATAAASWLWSLRATCTLVTDSIPVAWSSLCTTCSGGGSPQHCAAHIHCILKSWEFKNVKGSFIYSFINPPICSVIHPLIHPPNHLSIHSSNYSFIYSFIHPATHPSIYLVMFFFYIRLPGIWWAGNIFNL